MKNLKFSWRKMLLKQRKNLFKECFRSAGTLVCNGSLAWYFHLSVVRSLYTLLSYKYDKIVFVFYEKFSLNINDVSMNELIFSTNGRKTLARFKAALYFYFSI